MFWNYVTAAMRSLVKNKLYSAINIGGLAVGLAAVAFIASFVRQELTFDTFWPNLERIYRVEKVLYLPGRPELPGATTQAPLRAALESDFPEIEEVTRMTPASMVLRKGAMEAFEVVTVADPNFFNVLEVEFIDGDRETALGDPNAIVLSRQMAIKYFGTPLAVGRTLSVEARDRFDYRVAGVFEDLPAASHMTLDVVVPIDLAEQRTPDLRLDSWRSTNHYTYIRLVDEARPEDLVDRIRFVADAHTGGPPGGKASDIIQFFLTPVRDIHMESPQRNMMKPPGDTNALLGLTGIAALILIIAGINFVNLATARSTLREKEVALRKVLGASRRQIAVQFLAEALQITLLAGLLAAVLIEAATPFLNTYLGTTLQGKYLIDWQFGLILTAGALVFGTLTGLYPAMAQSLTQPARVLRADKGQNSHGGRVRSALVLLQFAVSISLIVGTVTVSRQMEFARDGSLGFDTENMLVIDGMRDGPASEARSQFLGELRKLPGVLSAGWSSLVPGDGDDLGLSIFAEGQRAEDAVRLTKVATGPGFFQTYDIRPLAGRVLDEGRARDLFSSDDGAVPNVVINETAARVMGYANAGEAVGAIASRPSNSVRQVRIVGVVPDLRVRSARQIARPMIFMADPELFTKITIRYAGANEPTFLAAVDALWNQMIPAVPIRRQMLTDNLAGLYISDARNGRLLTTFAILAIIVSCLGLFAMSSFSADRRTKEIGIRKALGASVVDIVQMMVWQLSKPVLWANLIAWPTAWYFTSVWLGGFSQRVDIEPLLFAVAGFAALIIAWVTVGGHALKVARTSPVYALKNE